MESVNAKIEKLKMKLENNSVNECKVNETVVEKDWDKLESVIFNIIRKECQNLYKGLFNQMYDRKIIERLDYIEKLLEEFIVKKESAKR
jgi:hypothetical protein